MGRIVKRLVEQRYLELTIEDCLKREERRKNNFDTRVNPKMFPWQQRFAEKLLKCPYCGSTPRLGCTWGPERGFDYKFSCDFGNGHDCDMGCGDWYDSLSRAGLSWNYRVLEAMGGPHRIVRHKPLTRKRKES